MLLFSHQNKLERGSPGMESVARFGQQVGTLAVPHGTHKEQPYRTYRGMR
jgi:hypothetical protein